MKSRSIALTIATFFGSGLFPIMPGTAGSFTSLFLWAPLAYFDCPIYIRLIILFLLLLIGVWASNEAIKHYKNEDPKQVVIDEVVGQGIPLLLISSSLSGVLTCFILFRIFDILKPWPIKKIENQFKSGLGVMLDDVMAGLYALFIFLLIGAFK